MASKAKDIFRNIFHIIWKKIKFYIPRFWFDSWILDSFSLVSLMKRQANNFSCRSVENNFFFWIRCLKKRNKKLPAKVVHTCVCLQNLLFHSSRKKMIEGQRCVKNIATINFATKSLSFKRQLPTINNDIPFQSCNNKSWKMKYEKNNGCYLLFIRLEVRFMWIYL